MYVFWAVLDFPLDGIEKVTTWTHKHYDDKPLDIFSNVYFQLEDRINRAMVADGFLMLQAPPLMIEYNDFASDKVFDWVKVEVSKDPMDENNYRKVVKVI